MEKLSQDIERGRGDYNIKRWLYGTMVSISAIKGGVLGSILESKYLVKEV